MKALITGGCGFVGSNLAAYLLDLDKNNSVTVFDNLSRHGAAANLNWLRTLATAEHNPITFIHGDIRNAFDVEGVVKQVKPDVIFHLAGQVAMTTSMQSPRRDFEINVVGECARGGAAVLERHGGDLCLVEQGVWKPGPPGPD